jgi:hypothetical protein
MFSFTKEDGAKIKISFPDDPDYNEQISEEPDNEENYDDYENEEGEIEKHKNILRNIKNDFYVQKNKIHKLINNFKNVFKSLINKRIYSKQEFEKSEYTDVPKKYDYIEVDYTKPLPDVVSKGEKVYIVDYSFKDNTVNQLVNIMSKTNDIVWCDHHTSTINLLEERVGLKKY